MTYRCHTCGENFEPGPAALINVPCVAVKADNPLIQIRGLTGSFCDNCMKLFREIVAEAKRQAAPAAQSAATVKARHENN